MTLNLLLPGAGQIYLGQLLTGSVFALGFIAWFVTSIVIFLRDYGGYIQMSTGGDIFETGNLERLTQSFHTGWLGGLQVVAIAIYIASAKGDNRQMMTPNAAVTKCRCQRLSRDATSALPRPTALVRFVFCTTGALRCAEIRVKSSRDDKATCALPLHGEFLSKPDGGGIPAGARRRQI